jgi:hypothetical protein
MVPPMLPLTVSTNQVTSKPTSVDDPGSAQQQQALKAAGSIFLFIAGVLALLFLFVLWVSGVVWVSEKVIWYVWTAADTALWVCIVILLPLSLFRVTRTVSCFGIYGASYIFGLCTWMMGFLTTYEYWGGIGSSVLC